MKYALSKKRKDFKNMDELVSFFKAASNSVATKAIDLAWCIFVWIAHNIRYDGIGFRDKIYNYTTVESVLESGLAVCSGYANLYQYLCEKNGIECLVVAGFAKGFGYKLGQSFVEKKTDHAWNAIRLNEKW